MIDTLIPLAEGAEEMETVIVADMLRRAGWRVILAGLAEGAVTASRGVMIQPDTTWDAIDPMTFDLIVLPGGNGGTERLIGDERVQETLRAFVKADKWVAAICAAGTALHAAGILKGRRATCYPGCEKGLLETDWQTTPVVIDGRIVTSRGPGTAFDFALTLIRLLDSEPVATQVATGMLLT
ncbi:MAG: DJ-1/PfpI family protein [Lentisphaerae bacterium]|nr:DJ-1/PfpI family protein [Lentisphaerota bacterium]